VVELHPVADVVPAEPWFACTRAADGDRAPLTRFVTDLTRVMAGPG
jgi:hypothetical protein